MDWIKKKLGQLADLLSGIVLFIGSFSVVRWIFFGLLKVDQLKLSKGMFTIVQIAWILVGAFVFGGSIVRISTYNDRHK